MLKTLPLRWITLYRSPLLAYGPRAFLYTEGFYVIPQRPRILTLTAHDLDLPSTRVTEAAQPTPTALPETTGDLRQATEHYQRNLISACLERHQHTWASAARELGLDRANLGRLAKRLGLK